MIGDGSEKIKSSTSMIGKTVIKQQVETSQYLFAAWFSHEKQI